MANNGGHKIKVLRPQRVENKNRQRSGQRVSSPAPRGILKAPRGLVANYSRAPTARTLYQPNPSATTGRRQYQQHSRHQQRRQSSSKQHDQSHANGQKRQTPRHIQKQSRNQKHHAGPTVSVPAVRLIQPSRFQIQQQNQQQQDAPRQNTATGFIAASPANIAAPKTSTSSVRPVRLVSPPPKLEFNADFAKLLSESNTDFHVVGIVGQQSTGKSTLLSALYNQTSQPVCSVCSKEHMCLGRCGTLGVEALVTPSKVGHRRLVLLDTQPMLSACLLAQRVQRGGAASGLANALAAETSVYSDCVRLLVWMLMSCHVVLVTQDCLVDTAMCQLLRAADMVCTRLAKRQPAGTETNTPRQSDKAPPPRDSYRVLSERANGGRARLIFVANMLTDRQMQAARLSEARTVLENIFRSTEFPARDRVELVCVPFVAEEDAGQQHPRARASYHDVLARLKSRTMRLCAESQFAARALGRTRCSSERVWLSSARALWQMVTIDVKRYATIIKEANARLTEYHKDL